ncbi:MAG: competence/damage-inducible protein A [Planctomycetes bacterium]|nr:competence/damage-inducible protein A [Planctomycetota bacterium]MCC7061202.1 competence/damage-inducible protein A [Planctomycetota bacterium]
MFDKSVIILVVSREILEGSVVDRNAAFIANRIDDIGYRVRTIQVVDRVESEMVAALSWALEQKPTFILLTGGMGPNWDDNSRGCLAKASGLPLEEDAKALEFIANSYRRLHAKEVIDDPNLTDSRRGMAQLPKGSVCYENTVGTAPAVLLRLGATTVFLLPGVPAEMQRFFTTHVMPVMSAEGPDTVRGERHVDYHGHDESSISRALSDIAKKHPQVSIRTRVQGTEASRTIRIMLVAEHEDAVQLNDMLDTSEQDLRDRLGIELHTRPTDASLLGD